MRTASNKALIKDIRCSTRDRFPNNSNRKHDHKDRRNYSEVKPKSRNNEQDFDEAKHARVSSMISHQNPSFNSSIKKPGLKIKLSPKKNSGNPIKLDKNLKNIEKRILQKMKNKNNPSSPPSLTKMPSIERANSPSFMPSSSSAIMSNEYSHSNAKNSRYKDIDDNDSAIINLAKAKLSQRNDKNKMSQSIRQTVAGSFRPNDPNSIMNSIQVPKPMNDHRSEYDMYNSYGSSNGFGGEKRLSNKMILKIKASFKYRDEVETAETDSFFSSKFSKFNVPPQGDGRPFMNPNRNMAEGMINTQGNENKGPTNFPIISKKVPDCNNGSLPSIK
mmetsp:Transcript_12228/g.12261  ORF Transcript_12228/g.12261 Transcript_12228/m.12261 type:complete len:331 (-) Transcript_12228:32-1024(-)